MCKYLLKFDHSLTIKCETYNRLTQKEQGAEVQQRAFEDKATANTPVLTYYDLEKPVRIQTDMSDVGVGAILLQNEKPVSYVSRVWITQVQQLLIWKTCKNRARSQTIRSNQQQASKWSTKKT